MEPATEGAPEQAEAAAQRDDGYETGNGDKQRKEDEPPAKVEAEAEATEEPPPPPPQQQQQHREESPPRDEAPPPPPADEPAPLEPEADAGTDSACVSPERIDEPAAPDESSASEDPSASPCPSNERSDESLPRATPFERPDPVARARHEDSSSQSQQAYPPRYDPYDVPYPEMAFGGIKREPYDAPSDPYSHYDPYARYKRPEEAFAEEMQYGFGDPKRDHDPYAVKLDPYLQHQFGGAVKREPDPLGYNGVKRERAEDPYSFVDEEAAMCAMLGAQGDPGLLAGSLDQLHADMMVAPHMMQSAPKKRGRKKKIKDDCVDIKQEAGLDGGPLVAAKPVKERKKHDRFNGMSEEEVCRRTLPDHLAQNLDIIIIGINPGLFAAYKGHHYAGPGNHFWKCLYLSGLTQEQMSADEDYKLLHFGIGFTNMVQRATKGSADLTRKEIKEGSQVLLEKLQTYRPKIAVFNGKLIYEVFSGKKDFCFGRQPDTVHGTNTYMWVMPSSSARCAQLPRAADKVPFYSALRRFRDYLNGALAHVDESELVFPDTTCRRAHEDQEIRRLVGPDAPCETMLLEDGTEVPVKKKRGRPKKIKLENGETAPPAPRAPRAPKQPQTDCLNGEQPPKKKRGRPKKVRPEDQQYMAQQQQQQQAQQIDPTNLSCPTALPNMPLDRSLNLSQQGGDGQYRHAGRDYRQANLGLDGVSQMPMYQANPALGGGGTVQNMPINAPATSPYFQGGLSSGNVSADRSPGLDGAIGGAGPGTPGPLGSLSRAQSGYGQSPGPFSQSPRPHGVVYGSSPRSAGYSQSPQRHQPMPHSYSNSPVPQGQTPHPYSQSPVPQNPNAQYSQSPPLGQNRSYSQASPLPGHPYSRSPAPQGNAPTYSQQSPMFAHSPAAMPHPYSQSPAPQSQGFSQQSPVSQSVSYGCRSPAPMGHPYPQSPMSQGASYPQLSPARQGNPSHPYSQSPAPQGSGMYAQSPQSQQYHSRGHPYSPASHSMPHHPVYRSPVHQSQARHNPVYSHSPPRNVSLNASPAANAPCRPRYQTELSTEISAAISSPGPASPPGMGHIDFEPPIDARIRDSENDGGGRMNSPGDDCASGRDLGRSADGSLVMGDVSRASRDSGDLMDACSDPLLQMPSDRRLRNRHSALNLIGPSSSSNTSSPIPSADKGSADAARGYGNSAYGQADSNEAQSPVSNEQRLGFQVPTPSGSANSSYGAVTPVAADLSQVPRNSPRDVDNASVASASSQHERMGAYSLSGFPGEAGSSPRQPEGGGLLPHHSASVYGNPFARMGSTPPHHPLGGGQPSPFSSQSGNGAFRGLPLDGGQTSPQSLTVQGSSGPVDYGSPVKSATTKQQDVSSKSLSGLESLVDQIPSIADGGPALSSEAAPHAGPASVPSLENPYVAHAPSLYGPYSPYQPSPYGPPPVSNNGYSSALAPGSFVGYPGSPYGQLMRPTPGYLPDALSPYHPHSGYPGLQAQQYGPGGGYGPTGPPPNYSTYYNGYGPPSIQNSAANMPTYLSSHVLDHIHKNAAADASSVSFGGFC